MADDPVGADPPGAREGRGFAESARRLLKSLSQTVKLISLYRPNHPVPASSLQESWHFLHDLMAEGAQSEVTLGFQDERWIVNDLTLAEPAQNYEVLVFVFRTHGLRDVTFLSGLRLFELAAFCEMAATPPNRAYLTDAEDFLKERGVRHVRANVAGYVRARKAELAPVHVRSPIPRPAPAARPAGEGHGGGAETGGGAGGGEGFAKFLRGLIDGAAADPGERAKLYGEAVKMVQQALNRYASETTQRLRGETQLLRSERSRTLHVLSNVADGKIVVDKEGRVLMMDATAEEIMGKRLLHIAGRPILENIRGGEHLVALSKDLELKPEGEGSGEVTVEGEDEFLNAFRQSLALVQDEQGRLVGTYAVLPAVAKFRETVKMQDEFLSRVTHDLKAPLASISSALEIIAERTRGRLTPDEERFVDISLRNTRALKQMITEILDFSRLSAGKLAVKPEPVSVEAFLREAVEGLKPWAESKRIALGIESPERLAFLPRVRADHGRVVEVLNNLISNAIKCTGEGGHIGVSAARGEETVGPEGRTLAGQVVVAVRDDGCGIAEEDQKKLFQKFAQVAPGARRREGVGLGLAIVKELVMLHEGRLWLRSETGAGATFFFSLPSEAAEAAPSP